MPQFEISLLFAQSATHRHHLIVPITRGDRFSWTLIEPENCDSWSGSQEQEFGTVPEAIAAGIDALDRYLSEAGLDRLIA